MPVTIEKKTPAGQPVRPGRRPRLWLGALIGSGDRIGALVLPFVLAGVAFNIVFPEAFSAGGPPPWLQAVSAVVLAVGVAVWAWSVLLIVTKVRAGEQVTTGPYSPVKHPLYTSVALLVLRGWGSCSTPGSAPSSGLCCTSRPGCSHPPRKPSWPTGSARN